MKMLTLTIISFLVLFSAAHAQTDSISSDKLHTKSGYMLASGTVFSATGIAFVGVGALYLKRGNQPISSVGGGTTGTTNGIRTGAIFVSTGGVLLAGGATLLALGIKARYEYKTKKGGLSIGWLNTGNIGLQAKF